MANSEKNTARKIKADIEPAKEPFTEKNIGGIEDRVMEKASKMIGTLEESMARWESLGEKPQELEKDYKLCLWYHEALSSWLKEMLRAKSKNPDYYVRIKMLMDFAKICETYDNERVK